MIKKYTFQNIPAQQNHTKLLKWKQGSHENVKKVCLVILLALSKVYLAPMVLTGYCPIGIHDVRLKIHTDANYQSCMKESELQISKHGQQWKRTIVQHLLEVETSQQSNVRRTRRHSRN